MKKTSLYKGFIIISIPILLIISACNTNSIASKITKKIKGNYYENERQFLINKIDTSNAFIIIENIYIPSADYKGCIFQFQNTFCIKSNQIERNVFKEISPFLNDEVISLIKRKQIDSLNIIDRKIGAQETYSNLIYYENNDLQFFQFNSSLYYEAWWHEMDY